MPRTHNHDQTYVTPAVLAASAKGLISANTTIYVATTGSDTTGTGASGAPYASIAKALSSIAGKLIASGVTVTIQVADGSYTVSSTITIDHPDADKIQILGNTSAETTVAITSIDTTAKTITVAGDYTGSIAVGDILALTGSSTSGLNGAYVVSGTSYSGGNTIITCSAETFSSSTVGGGSIVIKPSNKCYVGVSSGVTFISLSKGKTIKRVSGVRISSGGLTQYGVITNSVSGITIDKCVVTGFQYGLYSTYQSDIYASSVSLHSQVFGVFGSNGGRITLVTCQISKSSTMAMKVDSGSYIRSISTGLSNNANSNLPSPAFDTAGNGNSYISTS